MSALALALLAIIAPVPPAQVGQDVTLDGSASVGAYYLDWDFGDDTGLSRGLTVDHAWSAPGRYVVTATPYDSHGHEGTPATTVVVVTSPKPHTAAHDGLCNGTPLGITCRLGTGLTTPGGAAYGKVSHKGWPAVTGIYAVLDHHGRRATGTVYNDELLGGHGSDNLSGGAGDDILWGDQWPTGNDTWQHDKLAGGPGNDFIYASHGTNLVYGGAGNDTIWSYFAIHARILAGPGNDRLWVKNGGGSVDCGPGRDTIHVPLAGYTLHSCERVIHYCTFGANGHGGCKKPGERAVLATARRR